MVAGSALLVVALAALVFNARTGDDDTVEGGPPESVTADWADGQPVWVTVDGTGDVTIFDAVNPHSRFGIDELVGWCESSQWFEAAGDGSRFDSQGRYAFGPAPHGLIPYDGLPVGDRRVRIGDRQEPAPRHQGFGEPAGPHCAYSLEQTEHPVAHYHPVAGSGRGLFEGVVVPGDDGHARFCAAEQAVDGRCPDGALVVPEVTSFPDVRVIGGSFLAREDDGALRDVIYLPDGYESGATRIR